MKEKVMKSSDEKLEHILKYVSEHNAFYKKRIKEYGISNPLDITQWPILSRKELQENRYNMFSDGYDLDYYYQKMIRRNSSGTTGIPINIYWDVDQYCASMLPLWRLRKKFYGISPRTKRLSFSLASSRDNSIKGLEYQKNQNELMVLNSSLVNKEAFCQLMDLIFAFSPEWIYIQPSVLAAVLDHCRLTNCHFPLSIKYIETAGEVLSESLKKEAKRFFSGNIANMYGSEEMNAIAYEDLNNEMIVMNDNVFLECLQNNGHIQLTGDGEAIVTNLCNYAMPLIRYNQGDLVSVRESGKKGFDHRIITQIQGRTRECLEINGYFLTPFSFTRVIDMINNEFNDPINQYRFSFSVSNRILKCFVNIRDNFSGWENTIKKRLVERIGSIIPGIIKIEIFLSFREWQTDTIHKKGIFSIENDS